MASWRYVVDIYNSDLAGRQVREFHFPRAGSGLYSGCLRSEGRRRVNRVRTSPVAALSDARCRFGEPEALFFSPPGPHPGFPDAHRSRPPLPSQALRRPHGPGPCRRRAARGRGPRAGGPRLSADRPAGRGQDHRGAHPGHGAQLPRSRRRRRPCGECDNCLRVWNGSANLDVVEIDAASNRGVDDARDLRERAMYAASREGHHKVYIVDEAHMLTREAWNALLKILEEPPPGVVFVFATTEPQKIAAAAAPVLSRLQRFDFRRIGPAAIRERLRQVLDGRGHRGRRRCADADRPARRRRHARRALGARPVPQFRRRAPSPPRACARYSALVDDELYAEVLRWSSSAGPAASFRWWTGWSRRAWTWRSSWAAPARCSGRCSCCSSAPSPRGSPRRCARRCES